MISGICECQWPQNEMKTGYRLGSISFDIVTVVMMGENNGLTQLYELKSLISEQIREIEREK